MSRAKAMAFLPVVVLVVLILGAVFISNQQHAAERGHIEAPLIRSSYKEDSCDGSELWFSPIRGTVLVLCGMPNSNQWGGIIIRFTENMGNNILWEDAYECSCFVSSRKYWNRVITRDGYIPLANKQSIQKAFNGWYK